ncbi:MAG: tRNA (cytidine(34)-2'-O)-methyltransferase [Rhabdochlamydiaceae bacterium]
MLFQPQIPQNTGNIVRTCAVTGSDLILVPPFGFSLASRHLKRAGLDYWEGVNMEQVENLFDYLQNLAHPFYFFSTKGKKVYTDIDYTMSDHLVFGSETEGLPAAFHAKWEERFYRLPMKKEARCLNLANTVSVVLYEALRQNNFELTLRKKDG